MEQVEVFHDKEAPLNRVASLDPVLNAPCFGCKNSRQRKAHISTQTQQTKPQTQAKMLRCCITEPCPARSSRRNTSRRTKKEKKQKDMPMGRAPAHGQSRAQKRSRLLHPFEIDLPRCRSQFEICWHVYRTPHESSAAWQNLLHATLADKL